MAEESPKQGEKQDVDINEKIQNVRTGIRMNLVRAGFTVAEAERVLKRNFDTSVHTRESFIGRIIDDPNGVIKAWTDTLVTERTKGSESSKEGKPSEQEREEKPKQETRKETVSAAETKKEKGPEENLREVFQNPESVKPDVFVSLARTPEGRKEIERVIRGRDQNIHMLRRQFGIGTKGALAELERNNQIEGWALYEATTRSLLREVGSFQHMDDMVLTTTWYRQWDQFLRASERYMTTLEEYGRENSLASKKEMKKYEKQKPIAKAEETPEARDEEKKETSQETEPEKQESQGYKESMQSINEAASQFEAKKQGGPDAAKEGQMELALDDASFVVGLRSRMAQLDNEIERYGVVLTGMDEYGSYAELKSEVLNEIKTGEKDGLSPEISRGLQGKIDRLRDLANAIKSALEQGGGAGGGQEPLGLTREMEASPYQAARGEWEVARKESDALEQEYRQKMKVFYEENEKKFFSGVKRFFGIRPRLSDELQELDTRTTAAKKRYLKAGYELSLLTNEEHERRSRGDGRSVREYMNERRGARGETELTEVNWDTRVRKRYERALANKLLDKNLRERNQVQQDAVRNLHPENTPVGKTLKWLKDNKWRIRLARVGGYALLGAATGGVSAGLMAGGAVAARIAGGAVGGAALGKATREIGRGFVRKREEQYRETAANVKENFFGGDFDELNSRLQRSSERIENTKRNMRVTAAGMAMAGGIGGAGFAPEAIHGATDAVHSATGFVENLSHHGETPSVTVPIPHGGAETQTMDGGQLYDEAQKPVAGIDDMFDDRTAGVGEHPRGLHAFRTEPDGSMSDIPERPRAVPETNEYHGLHAFKQDGMDANGNPILSDIPPQSHTEQYQGTHAFRQEGVDAQGHPIYGDTPQRPELEMGGPLTDQDFGGGPVPPPEAVPNVGGFSEVFTMPKGGNLWSFLEGHIKGHQMSDVLKMIPEDKRNAALVELFDKVDADHALQEKIGLSHTPEGWKPSDYVQEGQKINGLELEKALLQVASEHGYIEGATPDVAALHESAAHAATNTEALGVGKNEVEDPFGEDPANDPLGEDGPQDVVISSQAQEPGDSTPIQSAGAEELAASAAVIGTVSAARRTRGVEAVANDNGTVAGAEVGNAGGTQSPEVTPESRSAAIQDIIEQIQGPVTGGFFDIFSGPKPDSYESGLKSMSLHDFLELANIQDENLLGDRLNELQIDPEQFVKWGKWLEAAHEKLVGSPQETLEHYVGRIAENNIRSNPPLAQAT